MEPSITLEELATAFRVIAYGQEAQGIYDLHNFSTDALRVYADIIDKCRKELTK